MSPPQYQRESSRTAPPDQSSQADRPSRKSPQAACPHQKSRIDPSYPHPRILMCGLESHKFRKGNYFSSRPYTEIASDALTSLTITDNTEGVYVDSASGTRTLDVTLN